MALWLSRTMLLQNMQTGFHEYSHSVLDFATLDPSLLSYIPYKDNAKALWDMLQKCFLVRNGPRTYELEGALGNCDELAITTSG